MSPPPPNAFPEAPIYLFYGNQVEAVLRARDAVLDTILPREMRGESLTEHQASGNQFGVELMKLLPEIAGDLSTLSLLSDSRKVVVVTNPRELYGARGPARRKKAKKTKAKAKKKTSKGSAATKAAKADDGTGGAERWLTKELPATENVLILLAFEDEAEGREINDRLPLFQTIARVGCIRAYRDRKAFFRIEETLMRRQAGECFASIDALWGPSKGQMAVYSGLVRSLRFMLQSNISRDRRLGSDPATAKRLFPERAQFNLARASDPVRRKYEFVPYRTGALLEAYESLLEVYRALRPSREMEYVADARVLLHKTLARLFASPPPGR